jgi:hypothetical protein
MAAQSGQIPRSQRFIKVYLVTWALMAVGALGYLSMLALHPPGSPVRTQAAEQEPSPPAINKVLAEMGTMRRGLSDVQKDVSQLKEAVAERVIQEKVIESRVAAMEDGFATVVEAAQSSAAAQQQKGKAPEKASEKISEKSQRKASEPRPITRAVPAQDDATPPARTAEGPPLPLETGSISQPEATITFGEAVVTAASPNVFAVQLAAGPSLPSLRKSWEQLVERHTSLAALQPRVVAPRAEGGSYRLLAGPLPTKAEAERVCTDMGVGRNACFATNYAGKPL